MYGNFVVRIRFSDYCSIIRQAQFYIFSTLNVKSTGLSIFNQFFRQKMYPRYKFTIEFRKRLRCIHVMRNNEQTNFKYITESFASEAQ